MCTFMHSVTLFPAEFAIINPKKRVSTMNKNYFASARVNDNGWHPAYMYVFPVIFVSVVSYI